VNGELQKRIETVSIAAVVTDVFKILIITAYGLTTA
jgi:hypothetical protein